ncbi:pyridoxine 5'-phosphate synthase [uncultured Victivallis sp.]|uniref:pyridoxine 5'-phosphate synthase n=1 Tax=uncultured Victivallis sp. TaxID=354118 RepID=UPI0025E565ED|nr:pyridoxine 5'-phosphate synthase [uncultured Victivallis sp.]
MLKLGVNIDHIATVRQARLAASPHPLEGALLAEKAGAWGITAHLREDRRHIQDADIRELAKSVKNLNMEMAVTDEMVRIACEVKPHSSCLVPEKRQELTTEGGLDVAGQRDKVRAAVEKLHEAGIVVSCFIDPVEAQLDAAKEVGADYVELHTGTYSNTVGEARRQELERLKAAAEHAHKIGLSVNAGHGIDYENIAGILEIPHLSELNIGHSIIGRAIMVGMERAVGEMLEAMKPYSK